ncbi:unnamed protein product [Cuscuta campestris]|uniref:Uncharacterized protein n=1 Tax=Cuscuta campestris TaxID=132261 RepID=A0A484KGT9_9ASTE|nr:unnamed protein product [Cuscuta campestris]
MSTVADELLTAARMAVSPHLLVKTVSSGDGTKIFLRALGNFLDRITLSQYGKEENNHFAVDNSVIKVDVDQGLVDCNISVQDASEIRITGNTSTLVSEGQIDMVLRGEDRSDVPQDATDKQLALCHSPNQDGEHQPSYLIEYPLLPRSRLSPLAAEFIPTMPNSFAALFNQGDYTTIDSTTEEDLLAHINDKNMALCNNAIKDFLPETDEPILYTHSEGEDNVFIDYAIKPLQIDTSRCSKTPLILGRVFKGKKTFSPSQMVTRSKARLLYEGRKKTPIGCLEDPDEPTDTFAAEIIEAFKKTCPSQKEVPPKKQQQPLTRSQKKKAKKKLKQASGYYGPPSFYQPPNRPPFQPHQTYHPHQYPNDNTYQVNNRSDYYLYHEEPPYDTPSRNFGYSPYQDSDGEDYYEPHGDHDDYDQSGPMCEDQPDPLVEEILRLEQKIFYFDELLFAEGSWYEPPYSHDYTLFAEEQIEANKVAIRERAKLLESVRKEKEFERRLCEGSELMQKMLDDFQRERLEAEAKADKLVNDLCKAVELKRSLQSQDQMREINVQKEALEPKTNPKPINQEVPVLEDSPSSTPSQNPESITTLARATVVILPEYPPSQVLTSIVVYEVEPTEGSDSEPPTLIQEKEEEVLPIAINNHLLNCVKDTPPKEPVLEEIEPITCPQDSNIQESEEESVDEEILCMENPTSSIETCANNASPVYSDQTLFDSLHDGCNPVCPEDSRSQKSWDELLVSDAEDSSMGENTIVIIKPQMDSQPIEDKEGINFTIKANDVDQLRRLPPPPTYLESPPFILLPPNRRDESRILDLDRAKIQTRFYVFVYVYADASSSFLPYSSYPTMDRNEVQLIDAASRTRFDEWGHSRVLHESVCLAQDTLTDYGYAEEMEELLEGTRWQRLFKMRAESSLPLTIEFLCSISAVPEIESRQMTHSLITTDTTFAFTLAGQSFQLTVREMAIRLRIYTQEETEQPEFYDDPFCLPADFDAIAFWREHSSDDKEFVNKKSKARYWIRPSWRILSFVLSTFFFGRPSNTDRVYEEDMFVFWSLHDRQPANVAVYLARFLYSQSYGCRTHLVCGFVITLLFRSLVGDAPIPRPVQLMRDLDAGMLRNAHIHRRLFPSSSESTTASTGRTSHEIGESSAKACNSQASNLAKRPRVTPGGLGPLGFAADS